MTQIVEGNGCRGRSARILDRGSRLQKMTATRDKIASAHLDGGQIWDERVFRGTATDVAGGRGHSGRGAPALGTTASVQRDTHTNRPSSSTMRTSHTCVDRPR
jgi:hypothetical protein